MKNSFLEQTKKVKINETASIWCWKKLFPFLWTYISTATKRLLPVWNHSSVSVYTWETGAAWKCSPISGSRWDYCQGRGSALHVENMHLCCWKGLKASTEWYIFIRREISDNNTLTSQTAGGQTPVFQTLRPKADSRAWQADSFSYKEVGWHPKRNRR